MTCWAYKRPSHSLKAGNAEVTIPFQSLKTREKVKRSLWKMTSKLFSLFSVNIGEIRTIVTRLNHILDSKSMALNISVCETAFLRRRFWFSGANRLKPNFYEIQQFDSNYFLLTPKASAETWKTKLQMIQDEQDFRLSSTESFVVRLCACSSRKVSITVDSFHKLHFFILAMQMQIACFFKKNREVSVARNNSQ